MSIALTDQGKITLRTGRRLTAYGADPLTAV